MYHSYDAFYKLTDSRSQITAYVFDVVRASVPKMDLDEIFVVGYLFLFLTVASLLLAPFFSPHPFPCHFAAGTHTVIASLASFSIIEYHVSCGAVCFIL